MTEANFGVWVLATERITLAVFYVRVCGRIYGAVKVARINFSK